MACGSDHVHLGVCARTAHKKHMCPCGNMWVNKQRGVGNPLADFSPCLLEDQLVFSIPGGETGHLTSLTLEPSFLSKVAAMQQLDPRFARLLDRARGQDAMFKILNVHGVDVLYRFPSDSHGQLCIPEGGGLRQLLLGELHSSKLAGHLGARKTIKALTARVWWPRLEKSVKAYVRGCIVCQKSKDPTGQKPGLLSPMPVPEHRFDVWSMDFISGLPVCDGFNTIYTCIDKLSKFVRLIPCFKGEGELSAPECANLFFANVVRLFGLPKMVLHDRDSRFTSNFWRALWELLGTKVLFTSAYHPQTDGQVERTHRTIEQVVRCLLVDMGVG